MALIAIREPWTMVWHGRVRTGFGQGSGRPRWLGLLTVTPHSTKWDAMPVKTNCVDCKIPRAWMDGTYAADESDPNNCVSISLQSYRIAATTRWSFFRMLQGVSWSDFRHNFLQLAMPSTLSPKYWHFIFSGSILEKLEISSTMDVSFPLQPASEWFSFPCQLVVMACELCTILRHACRILLLGIFVQHHDVWASYHLPILCGSSKYPVGEK